jgi:hypothetical protein
MIMAELKVLNKPYYELRLSQEEKSALQKALGAECIARYKEIGLSEDEAYLVSSLFSVLELCTM